MEGAVGCGGQRYGERGGKGMYGVGGRLCRTKVRVREAVEDKGEGWVYGGGGRLWRTTVRGDGQGVGIWSLYLFFLCLFLACFSPRASPCACTPLT